MHAIYTTRYYLYAHTGTLLLLYDHSNRMHIFLIYSMAYCSVYCLHHSSSRTGASPQWFERRAHHLSTCIIMPTERVTYQSATPTELKVDKLRTYTFIVLGIYQAAEEYVAKEWSATRLFRDDAAASVKNTCRVRGSCQVVAVAK